MKFVISFEIYFHHNKLEPICNAYVKKKIDLFMRFLSYKICDSLKIFSDT
jgi:hypothetical protein